MSTSRCAIFINNIQLFKIEAKYLWKISSSIQQRAISIHRSIDRWIASFGQSACYSTTFYERILFQQVAFVIVIMRKIIQLNIQQKYAFWIPNNFFVHLYWCRCLRLRMKNKTMSSIMQICLWGRVGEFLLLSAPFSNHFLSNCIQTK